MLRDQLHVGLVGDQRADPGPDRGVVVDEQYLDLSEFLEHRRVL